MEELNLCAVEHFTFSQFVKVEGMCNISWCLEIFIVTNVASQLNK